MVNKTYVVVDGGEQIMGGGRSWWVMVNKIWVVVGGGR